MGIYREVETEVTCDTCGERISSISNASKVNAVATISPVR